MAIVRVQNGDDDPHPFRFFFGGDTGYRSIPHEFVDTPDNRVALPYCPAFKQIGACLVSAALLAIFATCLD